MSQKIVSILVIIIICISINLFDYEIFAMEEKWIVAKSEGTGISGGTTGGISGAVDSIERSGKSAISNPDYYEPVSKDSAIGADKLMNIGNTIIGTLQVIGSIISVAVLVILGIKYMVGSAEERAEYKKSMMPYIIGAIMVFAITNLLGIVVEIAKAL